MYFLADYLPGWMASLLGAASLLLQIGCMVHVLRTGRPYYWFWVILIFPFVGAVAYLLFEVRPQWGQINWRSLHWRMIGPQGRIAALREAVEHSPTIKNRYRLADELLANDRAAEACDVLQEGKCGPFADDAHLILRLAEASLECGRVDEARQLIEDLDPRSHDLQLRRDLVQARVLGAGGNTAEAEAIFQRLSKPNRSEGPAYYRACMLLDAGRPEEGVAELQGIIQRFRRGARVWRHQERPWYQAARRRLREASSQGQSRRG